MVAVLVLAVIAAVIIKSLMSVVAHDEAASHAPWSPDDAALPAYEASVYDPAVHDPTAYDPTVRLRSTVHDEARGFLLPAVAEPADVEPTDTEQTGVTEQTRSQP
jgi:hypothetical protein